VNAGRRLTSILLGMIGAVLAAGGLVLAVADRSLFSEEEIRSTTETIVADRDVQRLLAREVAARVVDLGNLEAGRDLVETGVALLLANEEVGREVVDGVMAAYDELMNGNDDVIAFNLQEVAENVRPQVVLLVPSLDDDLPPADELLRFDLFERADLPELFDYLDTLRAAAWWAVAGGIMLIAVAFVLGPERFTLLAVVSGTGVAAMFLLATWVSSASDRAIDEIQDPLVRRVARVATDEYLMTLDHVAVAVVIFGLIAMVAGIGGSWIKSAFYPARGRAPAARGARA
jgi:hypothetical protein